MTEKETEVTEIDLKLINDELEKFLEAEAKDEGSIESPGRNSHVSIITLCGKQMEAADVEESGKMIVCPLQGYLFGSSIELPETRSTEVKKGKASLGELFQRTKIADEYATVKDEKGEIQAKGTNKSAMHLVKKILRKLQASSRSTCATSAKEPQGSLRITSAISAKEPHSSRSPWPTSDGRTGGDPLSTKRKLRKVGCLVVQLNFSESLSYSSCRLKLGYFSSISLMIDQHIVYIKLNVNAFL